jgi:hypothetical protein
MLLIAHGVGKAVSIKNIQHIDLYIFFDCLVNIKSALDWTTSLHRKYSSASYRRIVSCTGRFGHLNLFHAGNRILYIGWKRNELERYTGQGSKTAPVVLD